MTSPSFPVGPETQAGRELRWTQPQEEAQVVIGVTPHLAGPSVQRFLRLLLRVPLMYCMDLQH